MKIHNDIKIEFANGEEIKVGVINGNVFSELQKQYKSAIIKIDGIDAAFYGMTESQIKKELKRIKK
jgi:hypothetical protein